MFHFLKLAVVPGIVMMICGCHLYDQAYKGNIVRISGTKGRWEILVNGEPFRLQGVGAGSHEGKYEKTDYLKLAQELGANTVRTWGVNQGTRQYLDRAHRYGLYVNAGIWMNPVLYNQKGSYISDERYKKKLVKDILTYVRKYKNHPAVLFWNIGNEVIFWTKRKRERIAFCRFLEEIIQKIHQIDPHHPVIYTSAFTTAVPYIKKYVPSLDILGVNAYGGFDKLHQEIIEQLDIPYIVTEYGTLGDWDRPKDLGQIALESTDDLKAHYYKKRAHKIKGFYGYCLGGFAFHLGDTTQVSHTWWNLTHGPYLKQAYLTIQEFYTGKKIEPGIPVVKDMQFSKRKGLKPQEEVSVTLKVNHDERVVRYEYFATTAETASYFSEYPNRKIPLEVRGKGKNVTFTAPSQEGTYRIYAAAYDDMGRVSVFNRAISVLNQ